MNLAEDYRVMQSSTGHLTVHSGRATKTADSSPQLLTVGQEGKRMNSTPARSSGIKEYVEFLRMPVEGKAIIQVGGWQVTKPILEG